MEMENETTMYYILITSSEKYQSKLDTMLTLLFDQIEHYNYNKQTKQPIQILVCNDNNPQIMQRIMLMKEINNSIYHKFINVLDEIDTMFIINFIDSLRVVRHVSTLNVVVTACNSKYFRSCLTLITSLLQHSSHNIHKIYVFDLGLSIEEQLVLYNIEHVEFISMNKILEYTTQIRTQFPDFLTPNQFAWKPWFIRFVFEYDYKIQNVFWIDSGIISFGSIQFIFNHINKHGYWLTEDGDWTNYNFTHAKCKEIMNATDTELQGIQLIAGLSGFSKDKGLGILNEWCYYCSIRDCVTGEHWFPEPLHYTNLETNTRYTLYGNRHDQSILSILRVRHNLLTVQKHGIFMSLEV